MAQTQSPTTEGYTEASKLLAGGTATAFKSMILLKTSCTADATQTYAGVTKCDESGCTIADATISNETTTVTDDTVRATHEFTAGASATVKGAGVCNDDNDVLFAIVCFNADVSMESGDKLTPTIDTQVKVGA